MIEKLVRVVMELQPKDSAALKRQMDEIRTIRAASTPQALAQSAHLDALQTKATQQFQVAAATQKYGKAGGLAVQGAQVAAEAAGPAGAVIAVVGALNELGKAASPAAAALQGQAWKDLFAVIGREFVPVTRLVTDAIRLWADVLKTVLPNAQAMNEVLQPTREIMGQLREIFAALAPLIATGLVVALKLLSVAIEALMFGTKLVYSAILWIIDQLRASIPGAEKILGKKGQGLQSSVGAGGFQAQFSQGTDFAREQNIAALAAIGGGSAQERMATDVSVIRSDITQIGQWLSALKLGWRAGQSLAGSLNG